MGHLPGEFKYIVDIENGTAELPGTGDDLVPFTEVSDVGKGVAHLCLSNSPWVRETGFMYGDRMSYNQALRLIESVTGANVSSSDHPHLSHTSISGRKTNPSYLSKSDLKAKISATADEMEKLLLEVLFGITEGLFDFENNLGQLAVENPPRVWKGKTLRECIEKWWQTA
jgi:hypothetical protein